MYIIPAIDLRDGKCVRLIQGQYDRQINYRDNPVEQARDFIADGAQWLHIVDLDGAKLGRPVNTETISAIAALGKLKIEVGGGLRDEASIKQLLDLGVERVIIGTKAVSDFEWFSEMAKKFTGKIALGLDAKGSKVATHGWTQDSSQTILEFAAEAAKLPLAAIIYTDIAKDGMMSGPNFERTRAIAEAVDVPVVASGGVNTIEDIKKLAKFNPAAAIIGRSLYEGTLKLADAIKAART
ncbi:MAG: 1-(5-phosphoribosyl)-5-[(5-phosphoribosylamino)methylideneamino]imidazole-4-carboxamide isomerase [Planctomycetota bacterium]|jgi:phosphoribosylformimino-5-aminoimidazole carboxamide ribotide isomerase